MQHVSPVRWRGGSWVTQAELLRYVVETLEEQEIPYMIGGSQAAVYYGEPRFTRDVDVVAGLGPAQIHALLARFPAPDFYVSGEAAREAVETRGQFNIIHPASGLKIDIFVNRDTPYDRLRLGRRRCPALGPGRGARVARAEDVIPYKLVFHPVGP